VALLPVPSACTPLGTGYVAPVSHARTHMLICLACAPRLVECQWRICGLRRGSYAPTLSVCVRARALYVMMFRLWWGAGSLVCRQGVQR
jgi:hypothetical protein